MSMLRNNGQKEKETKKTKWTELEKQELVNLYPTHTNAELCDILHKTEGQIRGMKERLGLNLKHITFSDKEKELIKLFYNSNKDKIDLEGFSKELKKPKTSISRYARTIGLTNSNRQLSDIAKRNLSKSLNDYRNSEYYIHEIKPKADELLLYYAQNEHPKGMLNKHHSMDTRCKMSISHIDYFASLSNDEKHRRIMKSVETTRKNGGYNTTKNAYSRCHGGYRHDLDMYFRSSWEANTARLLNLLNIQWIYEYKRFDFVNEHNGVLSYQPDFYLPEYETWIEVKGWMDDKSKKRLDLFKKYYPIEYNNLTLIDEKYYHYIESKYSHDIKNWEFNNKDNPRTEIEIQAK